MFGLDSDDLEVASFVEAVSEANARLAQIEMEGKEPAMAFLYYIVAWGKYSFMPCPSKLRCKRLRDWFNIEWDRVAEATANRFCVLCKELAEGRSEQTTELSDISVMAMDALFLLSGDLPFAGRFYLAARIATEGEKMGHGPCDVLLRILCARIWGLTLGFSNGIEEMLMEGIRSHIMAREAEQEWQGEQYALALSSAIIEIIDIRAGRGAFDNELIELIREGYAVLEPVTSSFAEWARAKLLEITGIPADYSLNGNRWSEKLLN